MIVGKLVLDKQGLRFEDVKHFFCEKGDVLKVSKYIGGCTEIDYESFKLSMPIVSERPNIYGFYIRKSKNEPWQLKYIGQRKYNGVLERLRQHLVKSHEKTGAKTKKIEEAILENYEVGVKLFSIRPDAMRLYYEERLISELGLELEWNQQKHKIVNQQSTISKSS